MSEGRWTDRLSRVAPGSSEAALGAWLDLVAAWNARIDLTAARDDDALVDLMVADAAALAPRIPENARVVDVGSGAGAPGLALALLRPDLAMTLVEPLAKRVAFLRTVIGSLPRTDVTIVRDKGEPFADAHPDAFDIALSRATLAPDVWVPLGLRLAPRCWTLLAKDEPPSIEGAIVGEDFRYTWPLGGAARRAARFDRVR